MTRFLYKFKIVFLIALLLLLSFHVEAKTQKEEYQNSVLYSEEYFDYLIEQAQIECASKNKTQKEVADDNIVLEEEKIEISENYEPFKLKIVRNLEVAPWRETFKVVDTKTTIPVGSNVNFFHNTSKKRNKYNSNDYKILAGAEADFGRFLSLSGGLETNYRGLDQIPSSKKVYITPSVNLFDKISFRFHNKMNVYNYTTDSDIELNLSPFKSKALDFGIYAATSRTPSGVHTESINFSTTFYFF